MEVGGEIFMSEVREKVRLPSLLLHLCHYLVHIIIILWGWHYHFMIIMNSAVDPDSLIPDSEPEFLNVYGAQASIPRNEFRQSM